MKLQLQRHHSFIIKMFKLKRFIIIEMARRRTLKHRKLLRRKSSYKKRKSNGGGWSDLPKGNFNEIAINPGNQIHFPYTGPGKDCTGNPLSIRPGYIFDYNSKGLPGLSGGKRNRKSRGGAAMPSPASHFDGPITNPNLPPVSGSVTPKPGDFPDTTGAGGSVTQPNVVMSMPGVPVNGQPLMPKMPIAELSQSADANNLAAPSQSGGRYGFFPGMGPLNPVNGVGTSPAPFGRIPCETGTYNPLNPNPGDIQRLSTAPLSPPFVSGRLAGGAAPTNVGSSGYSAANFPTVQVGQADSMRYYAPTAGYRNDFMTFRAPSAVPGLTIQTPYDAKAFNQGCIKTGGSRKNRRGGGPVALDAGKFTPVKMNEIWTRKDFDGTNGLLPVKFGGKRRTRRVIKNKRKSHKNRK
jgi:hypothetical protein